MMEQVCWWLPLTLPRMELVEELLLGLRIQLQAEEQGQKVLQMELTLEELKTLPLFALEEEILLVVEKQESALVAEQEFALVAEKIVQVDPGALYSQPVEGL